MIHRDYFYSSHFSCHSVLPKDLYTSNEDIAIPTSMETLKAQGNGAHGPTFYEWPLKNVHQ